MPTARHRPSRARALDPATPPDELLSLAAKHPREVLENPALPLLLLENPRLYVDLSAEAADALLAQRHVPVWLLQTLAHAGDPTWTASVMAHPASPPELLEELAEAEGPMCACAVLVNPRLPRALRDRVVARSLEQCEQAGGPWDARFGMMRHGHVVTALLAEPELAGLGSDEVHAWLSRWRYAGVQAAVVMSKRCPPEVLDRLSAWGTDQIWESIGQHPATPTPTLVRMARRDEPSARAAVAAREELTFELLLELTDDNDASVAAAAAANPALPPDRVAAVCSRLASSEDEEAQTKAALCARCPEEVLEQLVRTGSPFARQAVGERDRHPERVLALLAADPDRRVRLFAAWSFSLPRSMALALAMDADAEMRENVALATAERRPDQAPELFGLLARDREESIRWIVAQHGGTPPEIVSELAADSSKRVRRAARLRQAVEDDEVWPLVRRLAEAPTLVRRAELAHDVRPTQDQLLSIVAGSGDATLRAELAASPKCPPALLARLADDVDVRVCLASARNPCLPDEARALLREGACEALRRAVGGG